MTPNEMNEVIRHFDIVAESLRSDIHLLAEGHMSLADQISGLRVVMNEKFEGLHSLLTLSHTDLRRRVEALERRG